MSLFFNWTKSAKYSPVCIFRQNIRRGSIQTHRVNSMELSIGFIFDRTINLAGHNNKTMVATIFVPPENSEWVEIVKYSPQPFKCVQVLDKRQSPLTKLVLVAAVGIDWYVRAH